MRIMISLAKNDWPTLIDVYGCFLNLPQMSNLSSHFESYGLVAIRHEYINGDSCAWLVDASRPGTVSQQSFNQVSGFSTRIVVVILWQNAI